MITSSPYEYSAPTIDLAAPIQYWLPTALYQPPASGMPSILLGRWPAAFRRPHPYKSWICESSKELDDVGARLARPVPRRAGGMLDFRAGPDGALSPSRNRGRTREICISLYVPPEAGWPWVTLMSVPFQVPDLERERYAWDTFDAESAATAHMKRLMMQHVATGVPLRTTWG